MVAEPSLGTRSLTPSSGHCSLEGCQGSNVALSSGCRSRHCNPHSLGLSAYVWLSHKKLSVSSCSQQATSDATQSCPLSTGRYDSMAYTSFGLQICSSVSFWILHAGQCGPHKNQWVDGNPLSVIKSWVLEVGRIAFVRQHEKVVLSLASVKAR